MPRPIYSQQWNHASTDLDRKSTRLNSSHLGISYAVFCCRPPISSLFPYTTLFRSTSIELDPVCPVHDGDDCSAVWPLPLGRNKHHSLVWDHSVRFCERDMPCHAQSIHNNGITPAPI